MVFSSLLSDRVTLVKKSGQRFENIGALVQFDMIFTDDPKIPIEDGDQFERELPSGIREIFTVVDAGFQQGFHGIPAHYQSKVQKDTAKTTPDAEAMPRSSVMLVTGPNARVNIQSADSSTNVVSGQSTTVFDGVRDAINSSSLDENSTRPIVQSVDAMETAVGTKEFAKRYQEFIAAAAEHMTLVAPFLPALTQLMR